MEQTLEWARAQATAVMARAQKGAEQLLAAAGLGEPAISQVVQSIVEANDSEIARAGGTSAPRAARALAAAAETQDVDASEADAEAEASPPDPPVTASDAADSGQAEPADDAEPEPER